MEDGVPDEDSVSGCGEAKGSMSISTSSSTGSSVSPDLDALSLSAAEEASDLGVLNGLRERIGIATCFDGDGVGELDGRMGVAKSGIPLIIWSFVELD